LTFAPDANAGAVEVLLYTVGPGAELSQRYGHSLLCFRGIDGLNAVTSEAPIAGDLNSGTCFDFGIAVAQTPASFAWSMLRGHGRFVATRISEKTATLALTAQGRKLESQRVPVSERDARALAGELGALVDANWSYEYHPYWANCATQLRDRLDRALGGRLANVHLEQHQTFRELVELGLSGQAPELTLLALGLGSPDNDSIPSAWQSQFLPTRLRDAMQSLGSEPQVVNDPGDVTLPTSVNVGRATLAVLALGLGVLLNWGSSALRARRQWLATSVVGSCGLLTWSAALLCSFSEIRFNWALALLLPSDLFVPWLSSSRRSAYLALRVVSSALLVLLNLAGAITQPLWAVGMLALLPLGSAWWQLRQPIHKPSDTTPETQTGLSA
jgi:hypothetical protein